MSVRFHLVNVDMAEYQNSFLQGTCNALCHGRDPFLSLLLRYRDMSAIIQAGSLVMHITDLAVSASPCCLSSVGYWHYNLSNVDFLGCELSLRA